MFYKKDNCLVEVYGIIAEEKTALIFSPSLAGRQNGNGWEKVKLNTLIPEEYYNPEVHQFMSKNERNKIKERLTLIGAKWETSDNIIYNDIEKAILHEKEIIEKGDK